MQINGFNVTMLTADSQKDYKDKMPKLNVNEENFTITEKYTKSNPGVTLELNLDNFEMPSKDGKPMITIPPKDYMNNLPIIDVGDSPKYLGLFNSELSLEDIKTKGIDGFPEYRESGSTFSDKRDIGDFFLDNAEKYKEILSQLKEKYADNESAFNKQKSHLDKAFTGYFTGKISSVHNYCRIDTSTLEQYNNSAFKANAENAAKYFIDNFDMNGDLKSQADIALESAFPEQSTSKYNVSLSDYKIINDTHKEFFNKGTGVDIAKSLSQNQNLSEPLRKAYANMFDWSIYSSKSIIDFSV